MTWTRKDLVGIEELNREEIEFVLDTAKSFKKVLERPNKKLPSLRGKTVVHLFLEPSTRTLISFETAAMRLSADIINVSGSTSSVTKGESLRDTAENIQALKGDVIVLRHSSSGAAHYLARIMRIPVLNGGDGSHEHPTQALLDAFTLRENFGDDLSKLNITIVGDILFSRVARSNIWLLTKLGAKVTLCGPNTLVPKGLEKMGVRVSHNLQEAIKDADAVMLLRIQHERMNASYFPSLGEYRASFGLTRDRVNWLKDKAIIMHPGPINRGVELDSEVADSSRSVILNQVTNGIAVRMAGLYLCSAAAAQMD